MSTNSSLRTGPPPGSSTTVVRATALDAALDELSEGWSEGRNPRAEEFAATLEFAGPSALVELVYHEFCLAEGAGLAPQPATYQERFPQIRDELARLFGLHDVLDDSTLRSWVGRPAALPESGDEVGPYRLLREMGRGGLARVFLAEQADLDDRLVVVKIAARPSPEAFLLARSRHPNIVEVLRQAGAEDGGLHLIAMPFLGGATLAAVLAEQAKGGHAGRRSGTGLLAALDRVAAPEFLASDGGSADRDLLAGLSYAKAVAWIVARLADALGHASRLGVTHGDIKPANILLTADARPMLFDFNLAVDWRAEGSDLLSMTGGTLAYMAPERLRAMADPASAPPPRPADRHRADLYSLGLVLREALTGRRPALPDDRLVSPRQAASAMAEARGRADASRWTALRGIPRGLRPILDRCLASDPIDRYARMAELAVDLDRWRRDRRLVFAHTPEGPADRLLRWASRRRVAILTGVAVILAGVGGALALNGSLQGSLRGKAEAKLATIWDFGGSALFPARRLSQWQLEDDDSAAIARRNLAHYDAIDNEWRARDDVRSLADSDRDDLESWLLEQTWRLVVALTARSDSPDDWSRALGLLERCPEWSSLASWEQARRSLRERLGEPPPSQARPPSSRWLDAFASGLEAEPRSAREARWYYAAALDERPGAFWVNYRASAVASRLNDHAAAVEHLSRCLGRRPRNPALLTLKAGCSLLVGHAEAALEACNSALEIDPDYRDAYFNRGLIRARLGQSSAALADTGRFTLLSRAHPVEAWSLRLALADGRSQAEEVPARVAEAAGAYEILAVQYEGEGRADAALSAYDKALAADPDNLHARLGRAHLLWSLRRNEGRSELAALIDHPRFEELVRQDELALRAIHYIVEDRLRSRATEEARVLAERALTLSLNLREPGLPESPMVAESRYALARAIAPGSLGDPKLARKAADLLTQAGEADRRFLDESFARDSFFNEARATIAAHLRPPAAAPH